MLIATSEPDGGHVRSVLPLRLIDVPQVWERLKDVSSFAGSRGIHALLDPKLEIVTIDSVGVAVLDDLRESKYARVHITFWDKRLRGREYLCRRIAQMWMVKYSLDYVYTSIPNTVRTVIAFARRVGFTDIAIDETYTHLVLYKDYLHGVNSSLNGD